MRTWVNKFIQIAVTVVTLFSFVSGVAHAYEVFDFTSFTEDDPLGHLSKTSTAVTFTNFTESTSAQRVYKATSIAANENFTYDFYYAHTAYTDGTAGTQNFAGVSTALKSFDNDGTGNAVGVWFSSAGGWVYYYLEEWVAGSQYITSGGSLFVGSGYYMRLARTGTALDLWVYTDSGHTNQIGHQALTAHNQNAMAYVYGALGWNTAAGSEKFSGYISNLVRQDAAASGAPALNTGTATMDAVTGNITFAGSVTDIGSANVTTVGFQVAAYSGNYSANYTDSVNYGVATDFTKELDPDDLGLIPGTIYKNRALGTNSAGTSYGVDAMFTYVGLPPVVNTVSAELMWSTADYHVYNLRGFLVSAGANVTSALTGFNIGRTPGAWESLITWGQNESTSENSTFQATAADLLPDTTYYYQAQATYYVDLFTHATGYGDILHFTTGSTSGSSVILPDVSTVSAVYSASTGLETFTGTVFFSTLPIVNRGFQYINSLSPYPTANVSSGIGSYGAGGTWSLSVNWTATVGGYYQAWATDSANNTGYGTLKSVTIVPDAGGAGVSMVSATASGTSVALVGRLDSIGIVDVTLEGFAWSTTNNISTAAQWWQASLAYSVGQFTHTASGLNPNTSYYVWAGVYGQTWTWSDPIQVTTGDAPLIVTLLAPQVTTGTANSITAISFNATMDIVAIGGGGITAYGFNVGTASGVYTQMPRQAGSYGAGPYWMRMSSEDWKEGMTIFYQAAAVNAFGPAVGLERSVILNAAGTAPPGGTPITPKNAVGDFSYWLRANMQGLGMDNPTGHWAFMFIVMLIVAFFFAVGTILVKERVIRIVLAVVLLLVELAIVGGFMFSGLLGIWPVIILIFTAVGLIIVFGGRVLTQGRA